MSWTRLFKSFQQIREFSKSTDLEYPLRPARQRKTIPVRNPKRPHLPDPIETDPTAQRFKLSDYPEAMLVIREPSGMANLTDNLFKFTTTRPRSSTDGNTSDVDLANPVLSHPVLSKPVISTQSTSPSSTPSLSYLLPPPLRTSKTYPQSLTPEKLKQLQSLRTTHSITQLSKKFGVSRLVISILGPKDESVRNQIQIKNQMKLIRKQSKWSIAKSIKRQEKLIRRSMW